MNIWNELNILQKELFNNKLLTSSQAKRGNRQILRLLCLFTHRNDGVFLHKAFTLAEVLITLLIIGVVASIVIPSLVNNSQDAEFKTAWRKSYSEIAQASKRISIDNGGNLSNIFGNDTSQASQNNLKNIFQGYLSVSKSCNAGSTLGIDGCWHSNGSWHGLSDTANMSWFNTNTVNYPRIVLNNGMLIVMLLQYANCQGTDSPNNDTCGGLWIDVNGFKTPNRIGKDIFGIRLLKNGNVIPFGVTGDFEANHISTRGCDSVTYPNTEGWCCSAEFLYQ